MNDAKTIGSNALVLDTAEENVTVMNAEESKLGNEVSLIEQRAEAVVVASGADFEDAGLFLKQIKQAQKQVKDYWEPLRVSAKKSYDEVLTHRKEKEECEMKLKDMVELVANNDDCVVLKVKDGQEMNLISLGCFNGDEAMMRLTKGRNVTCTLFRKNGKSFSWHWGIDGYTLVSDQVWRMGQLIQSCIENDFGIKCKY